MQTLAERRKMSCLNFAVKCTENENFVNWFPLEPPKNHDLRATRRYAIPKYNCNRYDNSLIELHAQTPERRPCEQPRIDHYQ